jgi:hypothetical protein
MKARDPVHMELVDFVAGGTTSEDVVNFHPSPEAQNRVAGLIERASGPSPEEAAERSRFLELEHISRMAKARAQRILAGRR